ncbi:S8 family peptidase (plasmid) [Deinococcus aquaticus]|uniref:S8 family peptidase n=2 Tax=Deinococcus aquaticus TaxID=328692 RepID=A0ABY7V8C3_9DEIO|nr:S8 family peptidase [Deinococcus aquaticus]WDA60698.1 S8 family peptidase [Deinococcus aquaticus]
MSDTPRDRQHVYLERVGKPLPFSRRGGGGPEPVERDRARHAARLEAALTQAVKASLGQRDPAMQVGLQGTYLDFEFASRDAAKDLLKSLDSKRPGMNLASVHQDDGTGTVRATVAITDAWIPRLTQKITDYRDKETRGGNPQNAPLITNIEGIRHAALLSIFVGDRSRLPPPNESIWWEIWIRRDTREEFTELARRAELNVSSTTLTFPDREILLVEGTMDTLSRIFVNSLMMTEVRLALDTPSAFINMRNDEQVEWSDEAAQRLLPPDPMVRSSVLILDSGVNRSHPLIAPYLDPKHWDAWHPAWGPDDMARYEGHGTAMAGLALHGDLEGFLKATTHMQHNHVLESVKILPPAGANPKHLYGRITQDAVLQMEAINPEHWRVTCLAVTAIDDAKGGRPTAWSAAIDQLASGADDEPQRLIVVSAGNSQPTTKDVLGNYLDFADLSQVHSPAQAWNALTVGAYTERTNVVDARYAHWSLVAPFGDLSPTSSTSQSWHEQWPIKPDVVLEGGNLIANAAMAAHAPHSDVRLLTTDFDLPTAQFREFGDTSAAAALASQMAARLASANPHYWPETVRGMLVHSADWTDAMKGHRVHPPLSGNRLLLRRYGYGVPNLDRALQSASNDLTMVIQDSLRPFKFEDGRTKTNQMNIHRFPWSSLDLTALEGIEMELRVTLSYFIEPNPSERGFIQRFRYASHGLRFAVKGPLETEETFKARIQHESLPDEGAGIRDAGNEYWELGPKLRTSGSLHSDRWRGDIASLQRCESILIYPVSGWWREKRGGTPEYWDRDARYSLMVSLRAPETDIDIYTPIATALTVPVEIEN